MRVFEKLFGKHDDYRLLTGTMAEPRKSAKEETLRNFRENFIDNFEGGTSAFFPGW
ncbi:hypothetical protein ACTJJB_31945 [Chitinophaga sp. 22536]|uniref:hypothetical protein n=1 Tax=unclassified Chitinophaga TaxID=2619133 RepID=UPI003F8342AF